MQNKKIQLWALRIAGYNCKVEYVEGRNNCCAALFFRLPTSKGEEDIAQETTEETLDIDDRALEIDTLNSNQFKPRDYESCEVEQPDDVMKPHMNVPKEIDIKQEQDKD